MSEGDSDGLVGAVRERFSARLGQGTATFRLALAETRLAASSAALLVGIALAGAVLAILIWLLLVALAGYGLWRLGLDPAAVLGLLLVVHVAASLALALLARRLARDLRFARTRRALAMASPSAAPETPATPTSAAPPEAAVPPAIPSRADTTASDAGPTTLPRATASPPTKAPVADGTTRERP